MCKVHSTLCIDDPYYTRDGPLGTKTRNGGFEFTERKQVEAAVAASMETGSPHVDESSPAGEPMILEGQQVPSGGVPPPPDWRSEARAAPPRAPRPAPRAASPARARCKRYSST